MSSTPEGRVKELIKKWHKAHNLPYWMIIPSPMGKSVGVSDFLSILPNGVYLAIEAKRPGGKGKVTVHQQKFLDIINSNNGYGFVVDSQEDLDMITELLQQRGIL